MLLPVLCSCRLLLASLTLKTAKKLSFTFHLNMHYFWSFSGTKTGAGLLKMCLCSHFARYLFCQCTNISHKPSFVCLHPHTCHLSAQGSSSPPPTETEAGRSLFLTAPVDWFYPQPCTKKKQSLFFSVHPYHNLLAKMFFYSFGRPGVFLSV